VRHAKSAPWGPVTRLGSSGSRIVSEQDRYAPAAASADVLRLGGRLPRVASNLGSLVPNLTGAMPHILVIEDDVPCRRALARMLRINGYEVSEAADGLSGLACWRAGGADVVMIDLHMAGMGGVEIILQLRALAPALSIIVMSGVASDADRLRGARLGSVTVLLKPFSFDTLTAVVRSVLGGLRQRQA
jgi:CheY-like chemotaxis protein